VKFLYSIFFSENGLQGTTKTITKGIYADITFFAPFRGLKVEGEIFLFDFYRENGSQRSTKTISEGILAVKTFFRPILEVKSFSEGILAVKTFFHPILEVKSW